MVDVSKMVEDFNKLYECYCKSYKPILTKVYLEDQGNRGQLAKLCEDAVVYYPDQETGNKEKYYKDLDDILKKREPVNIERGDILYAEDSCYNGYRVDTLNSHFNYRSGGYSEWYHKHSQEHLPPNIILYTKTPIWPNYEDTEAKGYLGKELIPKWIEDTNTILKSEERIINVLNCVGAALDSKKQIDYKWMFYENHKNPPYAVKDTIVNRLVSFYKAIFDRIYQSAIDLKMDTIVFIGKLGGESFWKLAIKDIGSYVDIIFKPVFLKIAEKYEGKINTVQTYYPHGYNDFMEHVPPKFTGENIYSEGFEVPKSFLKFSKKDKRLNKTIFVNAWDCWTIIGNGNYGDRSLDGYFGRSTPMGLLGWPVTNTDIKKKYLKQPNILDLKEENDKAHDFLNFAKKYNASEVEKLLKIDPSLINRQPSGRWSALHQFAENGDLNFVQKLVRDYGGNLNLTNSDGKKPHEIAREKGHQEVAQFLETGTTVKMQHDILDMAKYANTDEDWGRVFSVLEKYPYLINVNPSGRWSILHQFAQKGDLKFVEKLVNTYNADITLTTNEGETPYDVAKRMGRNDIAIFLEGVEKSRAWHGRHAEHADAQSAELSARDAPTPRVPAVEKERGYARKAVVREVVEEAPTAREAVAREAAAREAVAREAPTAREAEAAREAAADEAEAAKDTVVAAAEADRPPLPLEKIFGGSFALLILIILIYISIVLSKKGGRKRTYKKR